MSSGINRFISDIRIVEKLQVIQYWSRSCTNWMTVKNISRNGVKYNSWSNICFCFRWYQYKVQKVILCARCLNNFPTSYLSNPSEVIIKIQEAILNVLFFPLDGTKVKQKIIRRERRRVWRTSVWFQHRSCARRRRWRWQDKLFPWKSCKLKYCFTSNLGLFVVSTHYWRE